MFYEPQCKPVTLEPWQKVFLDAADIIDSRGLAKGIAEDSEGRVCTVKAFFIAYGVDDRATAIPDALYDIMRRFRTYTEVSICGWNNAPARTKEEVVATLRAAAK